MGEMRGKRGRGRRLKTSLALSDPKHVAVPFSHLRSRSHTHTPGPPGSPSKVSSIMGHQIQILSLLPLTSWQALAQSSAVS